MAEKRVIDWESIELEYRAGVKTLREIASSHGITHGAINRRAIRDDWTRNLSAKIQSKADAIVSKAEVSKKVSKKNLVTEKQIIEVNANIQATVILEEREDVKRLTRICELLEKQLETIANDPDSEEDLEKKARINKTLIESRDKVFNMRRRNYGINDNANGDADEKPTSKKITFEVISGRNDKAN